MERILVGILIGMVSGYFLNEVIKGNFILILHLIMGLYLGVRLLKFLSDD